jgi:PAS domain S-box-containing protein
LGIYADLQDRQTALSLLGKPGSIRDLELKLRTKSGELRHVTISVEAIVVDDEPCYLTILRDITEQKHAVQALRESEERFRVALQYAPLMVFHYDQDMRYTWAFNTHPDFPPEVMIGKTDAELVPGELGWELTEFKRKVFETGRGARREISITLSDGQHTYDLSAEPMRDAQGTIIGVTAAAMDITERKQTGAALERERELLRRLFDRIPVMIAIYRPDARVVQLNRAFERLTGWRTEEASQVDFMEKCYPDAKYRQTVRAFMESLQEGWMDIDMTTRDGSILHSSWSNIRLSDDTQVGIGIDIRDRKRAEEILKNAVQQFEKRDRDLEEFARLDGGIAPEKAG